jgi:hypothetical protein
MISYTHILVIYNEKRNRVLVLSQFSHIALGIKCVKVQLGYIYGNTYVLAQVFQLFRCKWLPKTISTSASLSQATKLKYEKQYNEFLGACRSSPD